MKLEAGGQFSWQNRFLNLPTWDFVKSYRFRSFDYNDFKYEQNDSALSMLTFGAKFGGFSFQGLRGEYTVTDVDTRDMRVKYINSRKIISIVPDCPICRMLFPQSRTAA